jgi:hypothetical protein
VFSLSRVPIRGCPNSGHGDYSRLSSGVGDTQLGDQGIRQHIGQRDELAPPSITSSALACSVSGTVRLSFIRFITSSNFIGKPPVREGSADKGGGAVVVARRA